MAFTLVPKQSTKQDNMPAVVDVSGSDGNLPVSLE
jgi:hypothetical protein